MHLYKYRGGEQAIFERDLQSIIECYCWAAAISTLNDPCEALINTEVYFNDLNTFESIAKLLSNRSADLSTIRNATNQLLNKALTLGIFSLSKNYNDELMWSHYGAAHHGFCVGYNMHYLNKSLKPFFNNLIEVHYQEKPPEINFMKQMLSKDNGEMILQLIGTKSLKWANEQEVRLVCDKPGKQMHDFRAIDEIYFGLRMPEVHKEQIMSVLKGREINYFQMQMAKGAYNFFAQPVLDKYANSPKYLYKIAPLMDGAIDEKSTQTIFEHLTDYLQRAAEIVRREPYCIEVITVDFSYTCPDDAPLIFAHCKRTDFPYGYGNFEYTLEEIDNLFKAISDLS